MRLDQVNVVDFVLKFSSEQIHSTLVYVFINFNRLNENINPNEVYFYIHY